MDYDWYAYGFGTQWGGPYGSSYAIRFPHWFLAMLLMVLPVLIVRKRLKVRAGHCRNCDYDLTGNETGVCPECGVGKLLNAEGPGAPGMHDRWTESLRVGGFA